MADTESVYHRQHELHLRAEMLAHVAANSRLSPRAALAAYSLAHRAKIARKLIDKHVVALHFTEPSRYQRHGHELLAEMRRAGIHSPERVERMLTLAVRLAHATEATKREWLDHLIMPHLPLPPGFVERVRLLFNEPGHRTPPHGDGSSTAPH